MTARVEVEPRRRQKQTKDQGSRITEMSESLREQIIFNSFYTSSISNRTRSSFDNKAFPRATCALTSSQLCSLTPPGLHRILVIFQICHAISKPMLFVLSVGNVPLTLRGRGQMTSPLWNFSCLPLIQLTLSPLCTLPVSLPVNQILWFPLRALDLLIQLLKCLLPPAMQRTLTFQDFVGGLTPFPSYFFSS